MRSRWDPIKTAKTSFLGTLNMLGLAKRCRARFLISSTSEVYGDPLQHPQTEAYWGNVNPIGERSCYDEGGKGLLGGDVKDPWRHCCEEDTLGVSCWFFLPVVSSCTSFSPSMTGKRIAETLAMDYNREHGEPSQFTLNDIIRKSWCQTSLSVSNPPLRH